VTESMMREVKEEGYAREDRDIQQRGSDGVSDHGSVQPGCIRDQ
jgi:hypothetical protein